MGKALSVVGGRLGGTTRGMNFPGASPEEVALQSEQAQLLRLQRQELEQAARDRSLLMPLILQSSGLEEVKDETGKVTGYRPTATGTADLEIDRLMRERELAALKGELPLPAGLERELEKGRGTLEETLRRNLGTGFATSTPGMEALAEAERQRVTTIDAARRGDISQMAELLAGRRGQTTAQFGQITQPGLNIAGAFGSAAAGYNQPLATYLGGRTARSQNLIEQGKLRTAHRGQSFQLIGDIFGR